LASKSDYYAYSEQSNNPDQRWIFIGNAQNWEKPMCELVLNRRSSKDFWRPHFQIDVDTTLQRSEVLDIAKKYLGMDFIRWELNIPNYGVVLMMGVLENIGGSKIVLGIGTKLRNTEHLRKGELRLL